MFRSNIVISPQPTDLLIQDVAEKNRARNESEQMDQRHAESDRSCFVALVDASNRDQEVGRSPGCADELQEAHDGEEDEKLLLTVDSARP